MSQGWNRLTPVKSYRLPASQGLFFFLDFCRSSVSFPETFVVPRPVIVPEGG